MFLNAWTFLGTIGFGRCVTHCNHTISIVPIKCDGINCLPLSVFWGPRTNERTNGRSIRLSKTIGIRWLYCFCEWLSLSVSVQCLVGCACAHSLPFIKPAFVTFIHALIRTHTHMSFKICNTHSNHQCKHLQLNSIQVNSEPIRSPVASSSTHYIFNGKYCRLAAFNWFTTCCRLWRKLNGMVVSIHRHKYHLISSIFCGWWNLVWNLNFK